MNFVFPCFAGLNACPRSQLHLDTQHNNVYFNIIKVMYFLHNSTPILIDVLLLLASQCTNLHIRWIPPDHTSPHCEIRQYQTYHINSLGHVHRNRATQNRFTYNSITYSMLKITAAILQISDQKAIDVFLSLKFFFMLKTINKFTQRAFRLNHGAYMYIICVSDMAAIFNMATKKASADVKRSQFGLNTIGNLWNNTKMIQIRPAGPMLWETKTFYGGHL